MIIVNSWKPLTIITKSTTLDVAAVLDPPLLSVCDACFFKWLPLNGAKIFIFLILCFWFFRKTSFLLNPVIEASQLIYNWFLYDRKIMLICNKWLVFSLWRLWYKSNYVRKLINILNVIVLTNILPGENGDNFSQ